MKTTLAIAFLLVVLFLGYVQGAFGLFLVWNLFPVALGFALLMLGLRSRSAAAIGCIAFGLSVTVLIVLFHLAWLLDWGGAATSSSTSALAFIFVPLWAIAFAVAIGTVAAVIARVLNRRVLENGSSRIAS